MTIRTAPSNPDASPASTKAAPPRSVFEAHDHSGCAATALAEAERACRDAGVRLTPVRRRVLEYLWESHRPVGAYRLLERLTEDGLGSRPPSVYRALDFLVEHGLAHKLLSRSAYLGCAHPGRPHAPQFLICRGCDVIEEFADDALAKHVEDAARAAGFEPALTALEVEGWCPACQEKGASEKTGG